MHSIAEATRSRIDLVIDGLDEAEASDQNEIAKLLISLPPGGLLVVGTQDVTAAKVFKNRVMIGELSDPSDAGTLLSKFAARFTKPDKSERLRSIGRSLQAEHWRDGLTERSGGHLWILTEFLLWIEKRNGEGWPDSPDDLRLAPDVNGYCELILEEIESSANDGWCDLETFLITLAVLDDRSWRVEDVMTLADLTPITGSRTRRMRGLVTNHASRLVEIESSLDRVRFSDSYFREHLRRPNDRDALEITRRIVDLVGRRPDADHSQELIRYAIERSAWHVIHDAERDAELASKLLFDTNWAPARLESSLSDLTFELLELGEMVSDGTGSEARARIEAVQELSDSIATWGWAIERGTGQPADWWCALSAVRAHPVWREKSITPTDRDVWDTILLAPEGGYCARGRAASSTGWFGL